MSFEHPGIDHAVVNSDFHSSRVCIVPISDMDEAIAGMRLQFPHDAIRTATMGDDVCVYTDSAPASLVAERISFYLREMKKAA